MLFLQLVEEFFHFIILYNFLLENVSACFRAFNHLYAFGVVTSRVTSLKGSDRFLCHSKISFLMINTFLTLLNLFVKSVFFEDRIILHELQTIRSVLAVLCGNVTRRTWHTAGLVFSAL